MLSMRSCSSYVKRSSSSDGLSSIRVRASSCTIADSVSAFYLSLLNSAKKIV